MRKAAFVLGLLLLVPLLLLPSSSFSGQKLFVLDLKVKHGIKKSLAEALSVVIRDEIHSFGTYEVLSREDVDAVAERATIEQLLGCDEDQCLIDLGRQIGTKFLVAGALSKLGDKYYFSLRLLDTGGQAPGVKKRVNWICPCDEGELIDAARSLAGKLFDREVAVATPGGGTPVAPSGKKSFTNSIGMKFVLIPDGSFEMGSAHSASQVASKYGGKSEYFTDEHPQHRVTISKPFYMQATEVTQGQWKRVMGSNPSHFKDCGDDCPVEQVSWNDCHEFIRKLNQMEGVDKYRLPTEAEWEYACRAGSTTAYCFGDGTGELGSYAWYSGNSGSRTHPATQKRQNAWGLYDMHGNVWEWCQDWYGSYPSGHVTDPKGPSSGENRVLRGGGWYYLARFIRSAYRYWRSPDHRYYYFGFRLSRDK